MTVTPNLHKMCLCCVSIPATELVPILVNVCVCVAAFVARAEKIHRATIFCFVLFHYDVVFSDGWMAERIKEKTEGV